MKKFMQNTLRISASYFIGFFAPPIDIITNFLGLTVLRRKYSKKLLKCPKFAHRELLWEFAAKSLNANSSKLLYLEFGVHKGYSIEYFSNLISNSESKLIGFDSFEGLPESWRNFINVYQAKHFDVGGEIPKVDDQRISFQKGWFNKTLPNLLKNKQDICNYEKVLIHLDADLYPSTLYVLSTIINLFDEFYCIFDELPGEEARALNDFAGAYGISIEFLGYSGPSHVFPMQVFTKLYK